MEEVNEHTRYQAALVELTRSVLAGAGFPALRRQVITLVSQVLAVEYSAIWELRSGHSALVLEEGIGWQKELFGRAMLAVETPSSFGSVVLGATPVVVPDWRSETRFEQPSPLHDMQVTSSFYVAIQGACRLYGILGVDSAEQRTFNDVEIHFLQVITNVLAVAGERAQPDAVLDQRVEARTREIEQRLVAAAQDKAVLEERQRLARDLHDSVTQSLYSITLHATAAQRLLIAGDIASTASNLRELQDRAQEALDEMRLLIFELRPPVLEQVGLVAALQSRLNAVEGRANLKTALLVDGLGSLPSFAEEALYRISQEALNNALRHAHAHHITVRLRQVTSSVMLEIVDDGVGFDVATAQEAGGQGLRGIAERVTQLGGRLIVRSAPGTGTELRVEFVV